MRAIVFIGFLFFCYPVLTQGQKKIDLPYKGGSAQFNTDVKSSLFVVSGDSVGIYFVEVYYLKKKKEVRFIIHGGEEKEKKTMTKLVETFFAGTKENWDVQILKKTGVIIPLIIIPRNDNTNIDISPVFLNSITLNESFSKSFRPKKYFLYKPLFLFRHVLEIDME